jgi:hypothetical protein
MPRLPGAHDPLPPPVEHEEGGGEADEHAADAAEPITAAC